MTKEQDRQAAVEALADLFVDLPYEGYLGERLAERGIALLETSGFTIVRKDLDREGE